MNREKLCGEIRADCAYTVREFCQRTGMGYRRVHEHFKARRMAGRRFILGKDFIAALESSEPPESVPITQREPQEAA